MIKYRNLTRFICAWIFIAGFMVSFASGGVEELYDAVATGKLDTVKSILEKEPQLVNQKNKNGLPVLVAAINARKWEIFKYLVSKGADVNMAGPDGITPLIFLSYFGEYEMVQLVVSKNAKVNATDGRRNITALHVAAMRGHTGIVSFLLSKGAVLNKKDEQGTTALLRAAANGHLHTIKRLVLKGSDPAVSDRHGNTPLMLAAINGKKDIVEFFISKGVNLDHKNALGSTAVTIASREGHKEITALLIAAGAKKIFYSFPTLSGPYLGQEPPGMVPKRFAPGIVSTEKEELNSVFTPDGKEFYFAVGQGPMRWFIMVMKMKGNTWTKPRLASFSGKHADVDLFITHDGKKLYFCSDRPVTPGDNSRNIDIWVCDRKNNGWSEPRNLGAPVNSPGREFYPALTRNGILYFLSDRTPGNRSQDIFRSPPVNGSFQAVEKLPSPPNTPGSEGDAFISPGEDYLIYSAHRPENVGMGDLFISSRNRNGSWSTPQNMGPKINTPFHENCPLLSPDGKYLFYTSDHDIYWVDARILKQYAKHPGK